MQKERKGDAYSMTIVLGYSSYFHFYLLITYCQLPFAYFLLLIAYCIFFIAYCLLSIANCLLKPFSKRMYNMGKTNSVRKVATSKPPITTVASGR